MRDIENIVVKALDSLGAIFARKWTNGSWIPVAKQSQLNVNSPSCQNGTSTYLSRYSNMRQRSLTIPNLQISSYSHI
jgi:hypothetical protein